MQAAAQHPAGAPRPQSTARQPWGWIPGFTTVLVIGGVIAVTLWQLHLHWIFTNSTITGGDTGAHVYNAKYLQTLLRHGNLAGWDPGWYDGYSLYTFYFPLPDLFAAVLGWIIPFNIAFKLITILGSLLLPISAWACGRLFRLRAPLPAVLAAFTLPFLFDYTYTIYGGNLFSTMAGEYAFSFSLSMALLFIGLFARVIREGTGRAWTAIVLAVCILSHIVPAMFALGAAVVLTVIELLPRTWRIGDVRMHFGLRQPPDPEQVQIAPNVVLWRAVSSVGTGLLLCSWWLVPFALRQGYATSMDYQNVRDFGSLFFPEADAWALVLAGLGVLTAILVRSRFGLTVAVTGSISALALVFDPQGSLYNVRLLPLWIVSVYLLAAWMVGTMTLGLTHWWQDQRESLWRAAQQRAEWDDGTVQVRPWDVVAPGTIPPPPFSRELRPFLTPTRRPRTLWSPAAVGGAMVGMLVVLTVVVPPFISKLHNILPVTLGSNELTNWSSYNYMGYQGQSDYSEYLGLITTMEHLGKTDGCGRAMWEYSSNEDRFGTPEALMLLPYWTDECIDSMEGLLFESSATTPYHFLNQAELSAAPSDPENGLPYGTLDVQLGVQHLQLLGVKYFIAETPTVETEASADRDLKLVATSGPWSDNYNGVQLRTTWDIYEVRNSSVVQPLTHDPAVLEGVHPSSSPTNSSSWLKRSIAWYTHPNRWLVELAQSGPSAWPRAQLTSTHPKAVPLPAVSVSGIEQGLSSLTFNVSRVGVPMLVKISYFPNWHVTGATGPYRVTPNLMVVVPTSRHVSLTYGSSSVNELGDVAALLGLLATAAFLFGWLRSRRRRTA